MFQRAGLVYADVVPVTDSTSADIDEKAFNAYLNKRYGQINEFGTKTLEQMLQNLGLGDGRELNLAGLMLFGQNPQRYRPAFEVKAVAFPGTALHETRCLDNTLGQLEITEQALEELLVNALIHRDYFTSASIRLMVFSDRVEIISPGHLSDSLNTEAIRHGATNRRNPTLTEHAVHILRYRGLGTGIPRALHDWPAIDLIDDVLANHFVVVVKRQPLGIVTPEVARMLVVLRREMSRLELMTALGLKDEKHFREHYQKVAIEYGLIEMTLPDKPCSRLQKYRLTTKVEKLFG